MIEKASICWYRITKCGYYTSSRAISPAFGGLHQALTDLHSWSRNKQLMQTQTFSALLAEGDAHQLPIYLLDVRGAGDDWLITLWNQTPATDGQVASVATNAVVGHADVVMNDLAPNTVPGFATYFYVVPSLQAVAAVRFQHMVYGNASMMRYMAGFMRQFSRHVRWSDALTGQGALEVLGYAESDDHEYGDFIPYFKSEIMKQDGERELLLQRSRDVRKVIRRAELQNGRAPDVHLWQTLLHKVGMRTPVERQPSVRIEYEMPVTLEPDEMRLLMEHWDADIESEEWEDVGFKLRNEPTPYWLSSSVARLTHDLDVARDNSEIVNSDSLLTQLIRRRELITGVIQERNRR